MKEKLTKQFDGIFKAKKPDGSFTFILTKKVVDRDSEVLLPKGMRINNFKKNPVVLWGHDMHSPPIGKINPRSIEIDEKEVTADVLFDENDPFANLISQKVEGGFLNAGSIRFIPITVSDEPVLPKQRGKTITEYELLEFSMVTVPANTEALRRDIELINELKAIDDDRAKDWAEQIEELTEKSEEDITKEDALKPLPNEHSCRVKDPGNYIRFRRQSRQHNGKTYFAIIGFKEGGGSEDQSYRYPKGTWTETQAKAHCNSHDGTNFEPAKKENTITVETDFIVDVQNVVEQAVTDGIQKALNPLLMDEFQYKDEQGEPEWVLLANAMINLFHNKTLPDYQKRYVYDHLAEQYKKFDRKPPEFGKEPEEEKEPDEKFIISDDSINRIIETVTKK